MTSERAQRRIERLLDEAEAAADRDEWPEVARLARQVLRFDAQNVDAQAFLEAAGEDLLDGSRPATAPRARAADATGVHHPGSFAGGRYRVERFLGEGGKKRVFLAHDTTLDRDVAFGQFRTEGMDAAGRARVTQEAQAMGRVGAHPNLVNI
jgi:hypothetical protein